MEQFLRVGVITTPHGLKGEVKVFPTTDDPKRFKKLKEAFLETRTGRICVHPESVKFFKNIVIIKFKEFQTIEEVTAFRQVDILIDRKNAVPLKENENFIVDLIGLTVVDQEDPTQVIGTLKDVLVTGANDVYIVEKPDKKELLIPAIPACIIKVDLEEGRMYVHLLEGLADL